MIAGVLAAAVFRAAGEREEDFVYTYAASRLYVEGADPYDRGVFQDRVSALLGRKNPYVSGAFASAYPPGALLLFAPAAALPYDAAFFVWSAALFFSLLMIWLSLADLCGVRPDGFEGLLLAAALVSFPGLHHSVSYHRAAVPALAAFLVGAVAFKRGRTGWGAFAWGLLLAAPAALACAAAILVLRRRWREAALTGWLGALQILPPVLGLRPWSDLAGFAGSLGAHAGTTVFFDSQSLAVGVYKVSMLVRPVQPVFGTPVFRAGPGFEILRWAGAAAALAALAWLARRKEPDWETASFGLAAGLLGSVYSHAGDQLWLIPGLAAAGTRSPFFAEGRRVRALAALIAFGVFVRVLSGPFQLSWYSAGYWTAAYLAAAWACYLKAASRTGIPG